MHDDQSARHTPNRSIRMRKGLWDGLGEVYGDRQRSAVLAQCAAYLLREPGAKLPPRAPAPGSSTD